MYHQVKPDWILIANTIRARVLQQERGRSITVVESFVHPAGRGQPSAPLRDPQEKAHTAFAHELAQYLEQEARQGHFASLSIVARPPFLGDLRQALGHFTQALLTAVHEADLTGVGIADLDERIPRELAIVAH
jgi:protein required for attachment to host cells